MDIFAVCLTIIGCVGIGAWLVVKGYPWFGFLAMIIGGCISYQRKKNDNKDLN